MPAVPAAAMGSPWERALLALLGSYAVALAGGFAAGDGLLTRGLLAQLLLLLPVVLFALF